MDIRISIESNASGLNSLLRCKCKEDIGMGFKIFVGCKWELDNSNCPSVKIATAPAATTTSTTATTTSSTSTSTTTSAASSSSSAAISTRPLNENEPVVGIGEYETLSDAFIVHIESLQLQMDQLKSETDQLKAKLHETESENQELKIKMNEIENLIISDKTIDVVKGRFKVFKAYKVHSKVKKACPKPR